MAFSFNNLVKSQLSTKKYAGFIFFKQRLYIFSLKISNENKQRLYKIQKHLTSLFYHVLLIKQNECKRFIWGTSIMKTLKYQSTRDLGASLVGLV